MKRRERTAIADLAIGILSPIIAPIIAGILTSLPVEEAEGFLKDRLKLGGLEIPLEHLKENPIFRVLAESAGGSAAGFTVATIVERIFPNISPEMLDYLQDLSLVVAEQYSDLMKKKQGQGKTATTSDESPQLERGGERVTPMMKLRNWLVSSLAPTVCVYEGCNVSHHTEIKNVSVGGGGRGGAPARTEPKRVQKPEFNLVPFEDIVATPGMHAPANAAEGYVAGCSCARAFQADKQTLDQNAAREAAANAPKVAAPGKEKPPSFGDLHGKALRSTDTTTKANAERLRDLLVTAKLNGDERDLLERCDTPNEYEAVAGCTTSDQLRAILPMFQTRDERGVFGEGAHELRTLLRHGKQAIGTMQKAGKKLEAELDRQDGVYQLCERKCVSRYEVLAVTPARAQIEELTLVDVALATTEDPATQLTPIAVYRQTKNQKQTTQNQQPAGAAQGGRPGLVRRLRGWIW